MTTTRTYTEAEVLALARRARRDPASLTPAEIRALALCALEIEFEDAAS